jgi:hypothetical protein
MATLSTIKQNGIMGTVTVFPHPANPCYFLGLKMKAYGLRGQGGRVSQMLVSRIPLADERKAEQKQCNQCNLWLIKKTAKPAQSASKNSLCSRRSLR